MPKGIDWKAPRAARPMRLMAAWYLLSTSFRLFHMSSAAYSRVPFTADCWRCMADAGGTPCLLTSRLSLSRSVGAARPILLEGEGRVKPYTQPQSGISGKANSLVPDWDWPSPICYQCWRLREKSTASAFEVSKWTGLLLAHRRLAAAQHSSLRTMSSIMSPSTIQATSSTKEVPLHA